jgi:hypothetical protein
MRENFVVDWQVTEGGRLDPCVSVCLQGRKAGLYRVKQVSREGVLLSHGAISFPVGTRLDIENVQDIGPWARRNVQVVANDRRGLSLAW